MSHEEKNEWGLTPAEWAEYVEAMKPNKLKDPADCHPHLTAVWKSAEAVVVHLLRERLIVSTAFLMVDFTCIIMYSHIGYFDVRPSSKKELIASGKTFMDSTRNNRSCRVSLRCKTCGIKSFYVPRSNQDGFAVTWRCLDDWQTLDVTVNKFDGQNWEANAAALAHKSKD